MPESPLSAKNTIPYRNPNVPLWATKEVYDKESISGNTNHYHNELEQLHVLEGSMYYHVNGKELPLTAGDVLFVNANQLHNAHLTNSSHCKFNLVLMHPSLLTSNISVLGPFLNPILNNDKFPYYITKPGDPYHAEFVRLIEELVKAQEKPEPTIDIDELCGAYSLLKYTFLLYEQLYKNHPHHPDKDFQVQSQMMHYIFRNYGSKITLEDLAEVSNISVSTCHRLFKKYTDSTPVTYINNYRLQMACNFLTTTDEKITQIAYRCGFEQPSYFNRLFQKTYRCTPKEFRDNHQYIH